MEENVQICEVGDIFYKIKKDYMIKQIKIVEIKNYGHYVYKDDEGTSYFTRSIKKNCFKTEKEAKEEIYKRQRIVEKRKRLKEYEEVLNEELNLEGHFIVK